MEAKVTISDKFMLFAGKKKAMDGRSFTKCMKDSKLIGNINEERNLQELIVILFLQNPKPKENESLLLQNSILLWAMLQPEWELQKNKLKQKFWIVLDPILLEPRYLLRFEVILGW